MKQRLTGPYARVRERRKRVRRTEYALILVAVAIVALVIYELTGQHIGMAVTNVGSSLTTN